MIFFILIPIIKYCNDVKFSVYVFSLEMHILEIHKNPKVFLEIGHFKRKFSAYVLFASSLNGFEFIMFN